MPSEHLPRKALVVGSGPRALNIAEKLDARDNPHYELVGFLDEAWSGQDEIMQTGRPLLGSLDEIERILI